MVSGILREWLSVLITFLLVCGGFFLFIYLFTPPNRPFLPSGFVGARPPPPLSSISSSPSSSLLPFLPSFPPSYHFSPWASRQLGPPFAFRHPFTLHPFRLSVSSSSSRSWLDYRKCWSAITSSEFEVWWVSVIEWCCVVVEIQSWVPPSPISRVLSSPLKQPLLVLLLLSINNNHNYNNPIKHNRNHSIKQPPTSTRIRRLPHHLPHRHHHRHRPHRHYGRWCQLPYWN